MEQQLLHVLEQTQSSQEQPRKQAEQHLQEQYYNQDYPLALCSIASQISVPSHLRQAALLALKNFVLAGWSPGLDEFKGQILVSDENKERIRSATLDLATSDNAERKIQSAASYVVSKIASADFPQDWSGLLPTLLHLIPQATGSRLHGALKVLADLVEDGFSEAQFFNVAQELVGTVHGVAQNVQIESSLRALAVSVFRSSFDTLEMILEDHKSAVKGFAEQAVDAWMPLFGDIMSTKLPAEEGNEQQYNGLVALKVQVIKVLMKVRIMFPSLLTPRSMPLFSTTWEELSALQPLYQAKYIEDDSEGRLEDPDGLPFTLDFLVLEDLDFLQACLRAGPVAKELDAQLQSQDPQNNWIVNLLKITTTYAQITQEEQGSWEHDVNVFLSEETSVTSNYTPRTACGDLIVKLGEKHFESTMQALLTLLNSSALAKSKEAILYLLNQILLEWADGGNRKPHNDVLEALYQHCQHALQDQDIFLSARGFVSASILAAKVGGETFHSRAVPLMEGAFNAIIQNQAVVPAACFRALQNYFAGFPRSITLPFQNHVVAAVKHWFEKHHGDNLAESDDLVITVLETLRDAILLDTSICVHGDGLSLIFTIASKAANNFQVTAIVGDVFEEICQSAVNLGDQHYGELIQKVLPSLMGAYQVTSFKEENPLMNLAAELLASLTSHAPSPLPATFTPAVMQLITPALMESEDSELLRYSTATLRAIVQLDFAELFAWINPATNRSGLETVLIIIARLLGPDVEDSAAAEVGGLAGEVVEQAGHEKLGPYLLQLLEAVALRLAKAKQAQLIQSLALVFARLALHSAREVVDFLASLTIPASSVDAPETLTAPNTNGLNYLLPKWLDACSTFVGYSAIRTNTMALATLYTLQDNRIAAIPCKGDLIPNPATAGRIVTRSRAKEIPDQYTTVGADVKMIKVLVEELSPLFDEENAKAITRPGHDHLDDDIDGDDPEDDEDGEWEDDDAFLDLGLGATKAELMSFANEDGALMGGTGQRSDDETQDFLGRWFREQSSQGDGVRRERFVAILQGLTEKEKQKLSVLR